ncbi:MAG: glycosyltransferase family 2 protein [Anaerolineae bacterium]
MTVLFILFLLALFLLFYTYLGYPLLAVILSRVAAHPVQKAPHTPPLTVIIPAFNEAAVIARKIENTLAMDYPPEQMQIIVVDDGSDDGTPDIVRGYADRGIELISDAVRRGKVAAMNRAVKLARGEIIVFTDADVTGEPDALRCMIENFADERVGCVTSGHRILREGSSVGESNDLYWRYESIIKVAESRIHSSLAASGHMLAVRRDLVEPLPEDMVIDDFYRALTVIRQGYRVIYEPRAIMWQRPVVSMEDEVKRRKRMTGGRYQVLTMLGQFLPHFPAGLSFMLISHKFLRPLIPFYMMAALVLNVALVAIPVPWWGRETPAVWIGLLALLAGQVVFYLAALGGWLQSRARRRSRLLAVPYYLVSTNMGGLQGLFWFLSGRRTVLWEQVKRE